MSDARKGLKQHPQFGYWHFNPPTDEVLREHYERRYFQSNEIYSVDYSVEETNFFCESADRKVELVRQHAARPLDERFGCLELGVGEGWSMAGLRRAGVAVTGVDYSNHGLKRWNPMLSDAFVVGVPGDELATRFHSGQRYDLLWLDNVLEHVPRPEQLMDMLAGSLKPGGMLLAEVPNDESEMQAFLLREGIVDTPYWLAYPEHLSYFSLSSLTALAESRGLSRLDALADFPIDWYLFNDESNYARNRSVGKSAHRARLRFEQFLSGKARGDVLDLYRALAVAGLGRNFTALFRKS